ncbi:hypothetical protein LTR56_006363 [Elasticomyces elasticus]|nr:hypothetical protein LTR56_006363 [Elasticomyces elasticus]KAK3663408.1 hypothetical protein LTR22_005818 [Elasticomyces elasticus]KAK4925487.1 hypothetical protein LTR49_007554 [Elasticomyces elasticus]KAK5719813.1 hypothetical protein LTR17_015102 [Elasticomyces elasticus]KAK5764582.1 hypothetical protein LTS12_005315 [Elasticomyces elasticus]
MFRVDSVMGVRAPALPQHVQAVANGPVPAPVPFNSIGGAQQQQARRIRGVRAMWLAGLLCMVVGAVMGIYCLIKGVASPYEKA